MQDRYLFRGKRTGDGKWVIWDAITGMPHDLYIQTKTICQCTGIKDKNGKMIWENDIVNGSVKRGTAFYKCLVLWNDCKARFDVRAMECNFPMTLDECTDDISICGLDYEVIGNKFDNPELLEV